MPSDDDAPDADSTSLALVRTHDASHDLDWLPPRLRLLRAIRWLAGGGVIAGFIALAVLTHGSGSIGGMAYFIGLLAAAAFYGGDQIARGIIRRRLDRLARGLGDLRLLGREADGELVHVRGRVRALKTLDGFLDGDRPGDRRGGAAGPRRGVFRRMVVVHQGARMVHEAAVDFQVIDDSGERVTVLVEGARLLAPEPRLRPLPAEDLTRLAALDLPSRFARLVADLRDRHRRGKRITTPRAGELLLVDGDPVALVGYKTRLVDPSIATLERETPMRPTLRSGREMPLLIALVPVAELPAPRSVPRLGPGDGGHSPGAPGA